MVPAGWDIAHEVEVASAIEWEIEKVAMKETRRAHVEPCVDPACGACGKISDQPQMNADEPRIKQTSCI